MSERACENCGASLRGYRSQARCCGGPCRAAASRSRAAERQANAERSHDAAPLEETAQNRTETARAVFDDHDSTVVPLARLATPDEEAEIERVRRKLGTWEAA